MKQLFLAVIATGLIFATSCKKENISTQPSNSIVHNNSSDNWYDRLGIKKVESNVKVDSKMFKKEIKNETYDLTEASKVFNYYDGTKGYIFKSIDNENDGLIFNYDNSNLISVFYQKVEYIDSSSYYLRFYDKDDNFVKEYLIVDGYISNTRNLMAADCDELGAAQEGESFGDCFSRNWNNFGCDTFGLIAQITNPYMVAGACAIESGLTLQE